MPYLSEEAHRHWETWGFDPYHEEHWNYAQQLQREREEMEYAQYVEHLEILRVETETKATTEYVLALAGWD
jgi:hypothetical protein